MCFIVQNNEINLDFMYILDDMKHIYKVRENDTEEVFCYKEVFDRYFVNLNKHSKWSSFCEMVMELYDHTLINSSGTIYSISMTSDLIKFYKTKERMKNSGKIQKKINKLIMYPLKHYEKNDFENGENYNIFDSCLRYITTGKVFSKIEYIKDDLFVIRLFFVQYGVKEYFRFYVNNNEIIKARINNLGDWVNASNIKKEKLSYFRITRHFLSSDFKETKLWYVRDILRNFNTPVYINFILYLLEEPILEQTYRIGLGYALIDDVFFIANRNTIEKYFEKRWGYFDKNASDVFSKLGINYYQSKKIPEIASVYDRTAPLRRIRLILGDNLSPIDNKTFDRAFNIVKSSYQRAYVVGGRIDNVIKKLYEFNKSRIFVMNFLEEFFMYDTYSYIYLYEDYLRMIESLRDEYKDRFNLSFKSKEELKHTHDNLIEIINSIENKKFSLKFNERVKDWQKFNYSNDRFIITHPTCSDDVVKEGVMLCHCVKSYIKDIAEGNTNIFFLRKAEDVSKPYFTVEVTNKMKIRQIHGFDNCCIDRNSAEFKFVKEWANKNDLKFEDINRILAVN